MPVYGTAQAAYARDNSSSFKDVRLAPGDSKVAFAAPPDESKLPSEAAPGDILTGTAGLCRSAANSEGPSRRPAAERQRPAVPVKISPGAASLGNLLSSGGAANATLESPGASRTSLNEELLSRA